MRLSILLVALLAAPVVLLPTAAAWPPVCIVKEVGDEPGGKVYAEVWLTCQVQATVTTCPKDGFCTTVSTDDLGEPRTGAAESCYHMISGYGWDKWLCTDVKGPIGCKVYWKTSWMEQGTTYDCVA